MKNGLTRLLCVSFLLLLVACNTDRCNTPFGEGGTINLTDPQFSNVYNHVGGTVMVSMGHKGVLIRCAGFGEYTAFECTCPHDHDVRMTPDSRNEAMILTCSACGSRFELINGAPLEGSVTSCLLYQYSVAVNGSLLTVY